MAKRLKCWREWGKGKKTWVNESKREKVNIYRVPYSKNLYDVYSDKPVIGAKSIKTLIRGKISAQKVAKSYMKKHDRCRI